MYYIPVNGHSRIYLAFSLIIGHFWLLSAFAVADIRAAHVCCVLLLVLLDYFLRLNFQEGSQVKLSTVWC